MADGNDSRRKIQKAVRKAGGRVRAQTISGLRKKLGLTAMSCQDFEMNLRAMNKADSSVELNHTPNASYELVIR